MNFVNFVNAIHVIAIGGLAQLGEHQICILGVKSSNLLSSTILGEVTERLKVLAWNASVRQRTVGSNPTLSAILNNL
jgi:hypothetical protein